MILRFILVFLFLFSCSNKNKVFLCGNHECVNNKERKEYFAKNLAIEVKTTEINKKKSIDLVKLNTEINKNDLDYNSNRNQIKIDKKKTKDEKRIAKLKIKEDRKLARQKIKEDKRLTKINAKRNKNNIKKIQTNINEKRPTKVIKKIKKKKQITEKTNNNICSDVKNCDIEIITERLSIEGKSKKYPNITLE